jgi:carbon-monoxide dehydrogenase small subunit
MSAVTLTVNGKEQRAGVEDRTLLVHFLRDTLGLTGTHIGCDTGQCGACVILLNGRAVKSCTMFAVQASGAEVVTIEGVAKSGALHPVQEAFREHHALQCGFCTPGMIMTAIDMIRRKPALDRDTIRGELEGNLCRCTGYHNIVNAIEAAAKGVAEARP